MVKQPPQGLHLETCNQPRRQRSRRWSGSLQRELRYHRTREPRGASGSGKGCSLSSLLLGERVASGIRREQGGSSLRQGPREQGRRQPWTCVLASSSPQMGKATLRGFSLGSVSYYNTLLQTSWLNAIHIYALTILESEVLMCLPSVGSRQESVPLTCPVSRGCPRSLALSHRGKSINLCPCLLQFRKDIHIPWLAASSSTFKAVSTHRGYSGKGHLGGSSELLEQWFSNFSVHQNRPEVGLTGWASKSTGRLV